MVQIEQEIQKAADEIRTWGAVAIIGAGTSFPVGYPLKKQLTSLLWHAVNRDEEILLTLSQEFGTDDGTAKEIIADNPERIKTALDLVAQSEIARQAYQDGFARLGAKYTGIFSPAHDALAELIHRGYISTVVSLNWDTLLEQAYRHRYGVYINATETVLFKPHGDAADPESRWVLPNESGSIPETLLRLLQRKVEDGPCCLVVIGYSESDEAVVNTIITPLSKHWRVVRIGPTAEGDFAIPLAADDAVPLLKQAVNPNPEIFGWEYVTFENQRGLEGAIAGYKLGPSDVQACPRLPEVAQVVALLESTRSVEIVGDSGCGKSVTAYHAAYDLLSKGWEVLRLLPIDGQVDEVIDSVANLKHKTLLIVDDAQSVPSQILRRLMEATSERLGLILATTGDVGIQGSGVRIAASRAVATLADELRKRYQETLEIVRSFDSTVGEAYLDEPLDRRIRLAVDSVTPWQFCFTLRGGWRTAYQEIAHLRDSERADLLLGLIACGQKIRLDSSVSDDWLTKMVSVLGYKNQWKTQTLNTLRSRKVLIEDGGFRCVHLQFATNVLQALFASHRSEDWELLFRLLRLVLEDKTNPLRGISWVLFDLRYADAFHGGQNCERLIDDTVWSTVTNRSLLAKTSEEVRDAAVVLNTLARWRPGGSEDVADFSPILGGWLEKADGISAYSLGLLINDLSNESKELSQRVCEHADPMQIATALGSALPSEGYSWGHLLSRLSSGASQKWCKKLASSISFDAVRRMAEICSQNELASMSQLAYGLLSLEYRAGYSVESTQALTIAGILAPKLGEALTESPVSTFSESRDFFWFALGYVPRFLRRRGPHKAQRRIARELVRAVKPRLFASKLSSSRRRDWEVYQDILFFFRQANIRHAKKIFNAIDFDALDKATAGLWEHMPRDLYVLLNALALSDQGEPARSWVKRHENEIRSLHPVVAAVSPDSAVKAIQRGSKLKLSTDWGHSALALARIAEIDAEFAVDLLSQNQSDIAERLSNLQPAWCEDLPIFLRLIQELSPTSLDKIIHAIEPSKAAKQWKKRLRERAEHKKAVAAILHFVGRDKGELSEVADRLRRRFPRATACNDR